MYNFFRQNCERWLRIPHDPEPPPGDEASTRLFRAAPNYYKYLLALWGLGTALWAIVVCVGVVGPLAAGGIVLVRAGHVWGVLLLLIAGLVLLLLGSVSLFRLAAVRLLFEKRWYLVTDRSLRIREGVVDVREMTVNFANIQNISISQGPIQRALGIADLRLDTAGGGGGRDPHYAGENLHTAWFRGVDNANVIRALIQERLQQLRDSGLGDHDELLAAVADANSASLLSALRQVHAEARALRLSLEAPAKRLF